MVDNITHVEKGISGGPGDTSESSVKIPFNNFRDGSNIRQGFLDSDAIEDIPEPSEGTLEGLRQCTQFISSASTIITGGDISLQASALLPASESVKSSCWETVSGYGSTSECDSQESFTTYKHKVVQLCHDIGLGEPSKVECMKEGAHNRLICLSLPSKNNQDYVLRIPRIPVERDNTRDQAAVLHYLAPLIPIPIVMAFDSTSNNAIDNQYVLQEKLRGTNAMEVYYDLPLKEKLEFVELIADVMTKLNTLKTVRPGQFIAGPSMPSFSHEPFTVPVDVEITGCRLDREEQSLASQFKYIFETRKKHDTNNDVKHSKSVWDGLSEIARLMERARVISETDTDCVVWHRDLAFHNILVEKQVNGKWAVTGVLDWDALLSVPLVMTRAPPVWLWVKGNDIRSSQKLTTDELLIKDHYDKIMQQTDPSYLEDAYGRGVWIRRLAQFALYEYPTRSKFFKLYLEWKKQFDELMELRTVTSQSSTSRFEQEEFHTYQLKVIQLCRDIGLGEPLELQRIHGGDSNRVVGITIPGNSGDRHFILRIPRWQMSDDETYLLRDQIAAILTLRQYAFLGAPEIAAVDTTLTNVIECQYVLQHKLPGKSLQEMLYQLSLHQKLEITTTVAQFLLEMEKISFRKPGYLAGTQSLPWTSTSIDTCTSQPTISAFRLYIMLTAQFEQRDNDYDRPIFRRFLCILNEMVKASLFNDSDSKNFLWHWDIGARHIFVAGAETPPVSDSSSLPHSTRTNNMGDTDEYSINGESSHDAPNATEKLQLMDGGWKVTGVIDWDEVMSVPLVLSRQPRTWLWIDDKKRGWHWSHNYDTPLKRELTSEELTIKDRFDQVMQQADPSYLDDTYGRGVWIRGIFRFAQDGFVDNRDYGRCEKFVEDWDRYYSGLHSDTVSSD
ncbi:hypothetical protein OCU04_012996 [Sclerotinia nivalis]|uniref:Aminoglycoside phosphotransferase domain-containing protein n=1 Tax=Sclerotinia nivalis TaxID=352851 RepID=A0A9X0A8F2_9HELO|nr:hypothetical protein OCU04_012996 [Sclerotinia nivalis]